MPTTIYLPPELLKEVDGHAKGLGMSRSKYIVRALKRAIEQESSWSRDFLEALASASEDREGSELIDEMMTAIHASRASKGPPEL